MDNKDDLISAMLREMDSREEQVQKMAVNVADLLWAHYCTFQKIGFTEDRAFSLTALLLNSLLSQSGLKKK